MAKIGFGRTREELQDTVKKILDAEKRQTSFKDNRPSKGWYYGFLERHPEISAKTPQALSKQRAMITQEAVQGWMDGLRTYILDEVKDPSLLNDPSRWYNADETPFFMCPKTGKIIAEKSWKNPYYFTGSDKKCTTLMACFSAVGHFIPPFIVFPGTYMPRKENPCDQFDEAVFTMHVTGFMTQGLFLQFLHFFDKEITIRKVKRPVMLLVDGSSTHISLEASEFCYLRLICLFCLLANSTHITQPCDVVLNSPLKTNYYSSAKKYQTEHPGELINKYNFPTVLKEAWNKTTCVSLAAKGFQECGLYPLDVSGINKEKFAPSALFEFSKENKALPETAQESSENPQILVTSDDTTKPPANTVTQKNFENPKVSANENIITESPSSSEVSNSDKQEPQVLSCITNTSDLTPSTSRMPQVSHSQAEHGPTASHTVTSDGNNSALLALEATLSPELLERYNTRYSEGFDVESEPLYNAWKILKSSSETPQLQNNERESTANANEEQKIEEATRKESAIDQILTLPKVQVASKKRKRPVTSYALSGVQFRQYLKAKRDEEENKAREKEERKAALAKRKEEKKIEEENKARQKEERKAEMAKKREEKAIEMQRKKEQREQLKLEREEKKRRMEEEKQAKRAAREEKRAEKEANKIAAQKRKQPQDPSVSKQTKTD